MDKNIRYIIASVIVTVAIVLISLPLWINNNDRDELIARGYEDLPIAVSIEEFSPLVIIEDSRAFANIEPTKVTYRNRNGFAKDAEIVLLYDKTSTIPYQYLKVSLGEEIITLRDVNYEEDADNYYFSLTKKNIAAYSDEVFMVRLWLNENIVDVDEDDVIITNFIAR